MNVKHTWPAVTVCGGGKPKCVGVKKNWKKGGGVWKFIPPRLQSVGVSRRYPPVLDPEDLGERKKIQEK